MNKSKLFILKNPIQSLGMSLEPELGVELPAPGEHHHLAHGPRHLQPYGSPLLLEPQLTIEAVVVVGEYF